MSAISERKDKLEPRSTEFKEDTEDNRSRIVGKINKKGLQNSLFELYFFFFSEIQRAGDSPYLRETSAEGEF